MSESRLQATQTAFEIRAAATLKELKDELKDFHKAAETRAAASHTAFEIRAAATLKELKDELKDNQKAAETRAAASQNAAETRAAASQKTMENSFAEKLNNNNRKLVPLVVGAGVAGVALFEWLGGEILHPWKLKLNK
jgi:hypothetical protein